jgi:protein-tyrosine phosphatase
MLNKVIFVNRNAAENTPGFKDWALISITELSSSKANLIDGWYAVHRSEFDDEIPQHGISKSIVLMSATHALDIVDFVHTIAPHVEGIMVHCKGGVSRSAAVAKWIANTFKLPFNHDYTAYNKYVYHQLNEANEQRKRR